MPTNHSPQRQNECTASRKRVIISLARYNDADMPAVPGALRILHVLPDGSYKATCPGCNALLGLRTWKRLDALDGIPIIDSMVNGIPVLAVTLPLHCLGSYIPGTVVRTLTDTEIGAMIDVAKYQMQHTKKPRVWMAAVDVVSILEEIRTARKAAL